MTAKFRSKNIADAGLACAGIVCFAAAAMAQGQPAAPPAAASTPATVADTTAASDYIIGPEDVLSIVYWRDKEMSGDVSVRPDGKISVPLLDDVQAAGLTPEQLRDRLVEASKKLIEDPSVSVVVRQMNSKKVFITGEVAKPGPYQLTGPTTVLQLIATAGGLREYADSKKIVILRTVGANKVGFSFNYKDVSAGKKLAQNIELKPGDTVVVP
jgi:polysaccharide biosynthesis/export protein